MSTSDEGRHRATLPEELVGALRTLDDLEVGQSTYVASWLMYVDQDNNPWLWRYAPIDSYRSGVATMLVEHRQEGYCVRIPPNCKWPRRIPTGDTPNTDIPIVAFI